MASASSRRARRLSSSSAAPPSAGGVREVINKLAGLLGSRKEVEQYVKHYSSVDSRRFAVIKVGGGVLLNEMETLVDSLFFLHQVGLTPVVIHGAGPQLNDALREQGVESDYIGGLRVTTPEIMTTARRVFLRENMRLVRELERRGASARPVQAGVFEAEPKGLEQYGFVGDVTAINAEPIYEAINAGRMPILTCMGETPGGQALNVNADIAARALAKAIQPNKVVYISAAGGLRDDSGDVIPVIDLNTDYARLMEEPWFKHGDRLKLSEIKHIMDVLPSSASVAITAAHALPEELFTHKGKGTLVRRQDRIAEHRSLDGVDTEALVRLVEVSFDGKLDAQAYLDYIRPIVHRVYLDEYYDAVAIVTRQPGGVPYLDKFAVAPTKQSEGTGQRIWNMMREAVPSMFWRSRAGNPVNAWYFPRSQGSFAASDEWTVFWYGMHDFSEIEAVCETALAKPVFLRRNGGAVVAELPYDPSEPIPKTAWTKADTPAGAARRSLSSGVGRARGGRGRAPARGPGRARGSGPALGRRHASTLSVALIGARGHTGAELLRLVDRHSRLRLTLASSRALEGRPVSDALPGSADAGSHLAGVRFCNLDAARLAAGELPPDQQAAEEADVLVLAMPNQLAAPFVEAAETRAAALGRKAPLMVDLSADYRFDASWAYGLPERRGARAEIAAAARVANPGCYATGMQASLMPLAPLLDPASPPCAFGVSGYSGAGTTPSRKNDPDELRDNLMPYSLAGHIHEREVSGLLRSRDGLAGAGGVRFMPHVAPWFRGISLTVSAQLGDEGRAAVRDRDSLVALYRDYYAGEPMVRVEDGIPEVRDAVGRPEVTVGGFVFDGGTGRVVVTTTLDNLLKGAATQCMQNINLMAGCDELDSIRV